LGTFQEHWSLQNKNKKWRQCLFVTDYEIKRWHKINGKYVYLIVLNKELWATVINDTDDATTWDAMVHRQFVDALHVYNEWKQELYEGKR
jgi:hypothetical protein